MPPHLAPLIDQAERAVGGLTTNAVATIAEGGVITFTATPGKTGLRVALSYPWDPSRADPTPSLTKALDVESVAIRRLKDVWKVEAEVEFRLPQLAAAS
ncbi:hypothetical protein [Nonomuraea lactucae]|uniref:hypothetical protein n=1 Tax=Nonomuraea lactucae TaxID=2249762 RepID=UPI000DE1BF8E|nr:hypothetical protein [Nonomuraea lactucae]